MVGAEALLPDMYTRLGNGLQGYFPFTDDDLDIFITHIEGDTQHMEEGHGAGPFVRHRPSSAAISRSWPVLPVIGSTSVGTPYGRRVIELFRRPLPREPSRASRWESPPPDGPGGSPSS